MLVLYVDYCRHAMRPVQCSRPIYYGVYTSNIKCMYTFVPANIVDCRSLYEAHTPT